jgi:hypothetical protein
MPRSIGIILAKWDDEVANDDPSLIRILSFFMTRLPNFVVALMQAENPRIVLA